MTRIALPIHFWGFMVDAERILFGHFDLNKETSAGMPVTVLVRSDPSTRAQLVHDHATIERLLGA